MSLTNLTVVDFISIDSVGNVVLTVADDLVWDQDNEHLLVLQNKLNVYLEFIESGNLYQQYPDAKNRNIVINIVSKYEPNDDGNRFLNATGEFLQSYGYQLQFRIFDTKGSTLNNSSSF